MAFRPTPEIQIMFRPKRAAEQFAPNTSSSRWRRPLTHLLILCTAISLLATSQFSPEIVASSALYWSVLPLIQIAALAITLRRLPDAPTLDRFFAGNGPWLLFLIAFSTYASSPAGAIMTPTGFTLWESAAAIALIWCCWIDYHFFGSFSRLALHRAVSWPLFGAIFAGSWLWREISGTLV